ncbi:hypothetical protein HK405_009076, partial [Cladochytrium tenue]
MAAAPTPRMPPVDAGDISDHYMAATSSSSSSEAGEVVRPEALRTAYAGGGAYVPPGETFAPAAGGGGGGGGGSPALGRDLGDDGADVPLMPFKVIPEYRVCGIKFNRRRRICLFVCGGVALVLVAVLVPLLLFVIGPKIAQAALQSSNLTLDSTSITGATNTSFVLAATGSVTNA